jgi:hypothetical protein
MLHLSSIKIIVQININIFKACAYARPVWNRVHNSEDKNKIIFYSVGSG